MNNTEPKIFVINTHDTWVEGKTSPAFDKNQIDGLTLPGNQLYLNEGSIPVGLKVQDFATDGCDIFYILTENNKLVLWDKDSTIYTYIDCIELAGARNIAVTKTNIYILFSDNLVCYARVNYQVRWEQKTGLQGIVAITAGTDKKEGDNIYLLNRDNTQTPANDTIYKFSHNTDNQSQVFYSFPSNKNIIDIAADKNGDIYCLYKDTVYKVNIIDKDKKIKELIPSLPLPASEQFNQFVINAKGAIYVLNNKNDIITIQEENRFEPCRQYITKVFDSRILGCQWHRVILDTDVLGYTGQFRTDVTGNTRIEVSYYVSDDKFEPDTNLDWSQPLINSSDALIIEAKGKYICFKIELFSDDQRKYAPYIRSFSVEFPHHSYLQYLPAVYQEDKEGSEFLARYLSLFESFLGKTEKEIHSATRYIDAYGTPDEFLSWLAQWLSIGYDENWSKDKLRELIKQAPQLYKMRGTRIGLEKLLNIYLGKQGVKSGFKIEAFDNKDKPDESINEYKTFDDTSIIIREHFTAGKCINGDKSLGEVMIDGEFQKQNCGNIMKFIFSAKQVIGLQPDDTLKVVIAGKGLYGLITNIKKKDYTQNYIVSINIVNTSCNSYKINEKAVIYRITPEEVLYGDDPYSFDVLLRPFSMEPKETRTRLEAVRKLVEREKPAHTEACVRLLKPLISLGLPTYLGINTVLSEPVYAIVGEGVLSRDTILSEREPSGQADVRGRVNIDTKLT